MAAQTVSGYSNVLRTLYHDEVLKNTLYPDHPLFGMFPKDEKFKGNDKRINLLFAPGGGSSRTFSDAQTNKSGASYAAFLLTRVTDYSLFSIENELLEASRGDAAATRDALKQEGDAALNAIKRSISRGLYGNTGGSIGRIASGSSSTTLTLTNPEDIVNFEVGMVIESDDTDGTSGGAADGEGVTITAVDRDAGTISRAAGTNWDASGNFAANDYLFREGDFGISMAGLASWLPSSAPSSGESFFGQDRSSDTRLHGVRVTATAARDGTIPNALDYAAAACRRHGGRPDVILMNPMTMQKTTQQLGDLKEFTSATARGAGGKEIASISYSAVRLMTTAGEMKLVDDPDCPPDLAYMLQMNTWKLCSIGAAPHWFDSDGSKLLRESSADALEGRFVFYGNLGCSAPGFNARINLSALTA